MDGPRIMAVAEIIARDSGPAHPRPALVDLAPGEDPARPTWQALVRHEPRLEALAVLAQTIGRLGRRRRGFCANAVWYAGLKPLLCGLVGWGAEHDDPVLTSSAAYDVAYEHLYELLPDCQHDGLCAGAGR